MKKFITCIFLILFVFISIPAMAADVVQAKNGYDSFKENQNMKTATFTVTADGSGNVGIFTFLKPGDIEGMYLMSVEVKCADDAAFQTLIYTSNGTPLFDFTSASADVGQIKNATDRWPITSAPKIDVVGLTATKIATIIVTFVR